LKQNKNTLEVRINLNMPDEEKDLGEIDLNLHDAEGDDLGDLDDDEEEEEDPSEDEEE